MENKVLYLMKKLIFSFSLLFASCSFQNKNETPIVILVSFDGFRYDYSEQLKTPNFDYLRDNGVKAKSLKPIFPSFTFPNHYSIATGCYTDKHGILGNSFYDIKRKETYSYKIPSTVQDGSWYGCEPIWVTAEKNNIIAASYFWVGSEAEINGYRPSIYKNYKNGINPISKVDSVMKWINNENDNMPGLITLYFNEPDHSGHVFGPNHINTQLQVELADSILGYLLNSINDLKIKDRVNIIVVSDHGMVEVSEEKLIKVDDYIDSEDFEFYDKGPVMQLYTKNSKIEKIDSDLIPHTSIYAREDFPNNFRFKTYNLGDFFLLADSGWMMYTEKDITPEGLTVSGMHGYNPDNISMHGIFYAYGPSFKTNFNLESFELIHIYPLICNILDIEPYNDIDGDINILKEILN